jgi:hypothetical protein
MKLQEYQLEELYKDDINNSVEIVEIWGMQYEPATVLRECDPIAYRVGFSDWLDAQDDCEDCDLNPIECTCEEGV